MRGGNVGESWSESVTQERATVVEAMAQARSMIDAIRKSRAGMSPTGQALLVLLHSASAIFDAAIALAETLEEPSRSAHHARALDEVEGTVQRLSAMVTVLATAITRGDSQVDLRALDQMLQSSVRDIAESVDSQSYAYPLQVAAEHVHAAVDIIARHGGQQRTALHPDVGRQTRGARLGGVCSLLVEGQLDVSFADIPPCTAAQRGGNSCCGAAYAPSAAT